MTEAVSKTPVALAVWWIALVAAGVLVPLIGGLVVIAVSRLDRFRPNAPPVAAMIAVWAVISAGQLVALFAAMNFSSSTDVLVS